MTTQAEFEAMILEALVDEGTLTTLGAENGVEIDGHGPSEGNQHPIEGWYTANGTRTYFSATLTVSLETFEPDYETDDDYFEEDEGDDE